MIRANLAEIFQDRSRGSGLLRQNFQWFGWRLAEATADTSRPTGPNFMLSLNLGYDMVSLEDSP